MPGFFFTEKVSCKSSFNVLKNKVLLTVEWLNQNTDNCTLISVLKVEYVVKCPPKNCFKLGAKTRKDIMYSQPFDMAHQSG